MRCMFPLNHRKRDHSWWLSASLVLARGPVGGDLGTLGGSFDNYTPAITPGHRRGRPSQIVSIMLVSALDPCESRRLAEGGFSRAGSTEALGRSGHHRTGRPELDRLRIARIQEVNPPDPIIALKGDHVVAFAPMMDLTRTTSAESGRLERRTCFACAPQKAPGRPEHCCSGRLRRLKHPRQSPPRTRAGSAGHKRPVRTRR
jgi:hypothetical protein